jgi:hypothetical protein
VSFTVPFFMSLTAGPAMNDRDTLDEVREGVRAAMQLSYGKLLRAGYRHDTAKTILLDAARNAVNDLDGGGS